jgi:glutamate-5-semialdehyde dehydrogenase
VGEVVDGWVRPNGLRVSRVRVPLGVVGVIYENRPNVTSDAAGLCLKAGNAAFLRGSASALASNRAIVAVLRRAAAKAGLPEDAVALVEDTSHETAVAFMRLRGLIDCLIPRGGPALIASLLEHATVPYVLDGDGNCHVYVDAAADLSMALDIVVNAKTHRFGVCNAARRSWCTPPWRRRSCPGWRGPGSAAAWSCGATSGCGPSCPGPCVGHESDFATEFLGPTVAWAWSTTWTGPSSTSPASARALRGDRDHRRGRGRPLRGRGRRGRRAGQRLDPLHRRRGARAGGRGGISTQKLHARGPMGVRELTSVKWVVRGDGQVRQ